MCIRDRNYASLSAQLYTYTHYLTYMLSSAYRYIAVQKGLHSLCGRRKKCYLSLQVELSRWMNSSLRKPWSIHTVAVHGTTTLTRCTQARKKLIKACMYVRTFNKLELASHSCLLACLAAWVTSSWACSSTLVYTYSYIAMQHFPCCFDLMTRIKNSLLHSGFLWIRQVTSCRYP